MSTALGKRKQREDETDGGHRHGCTLFVSNLPFDATSTDLQTAFSDLAPVRSAFIVLEHGTSVSKGVGYVSFALKDDAQTAFDLIATNGMSINGRNLRVQWADSKPKNKTKDQATSESARKPREPPAVHRVLPQKTNDPLAIRTIVVSGLPSSINHNTLWKKMRKFEGAETVDWPAKTARGEDPTSAHVLFSSSRLAQDAVDKLHAHVFKGSLLSATLKKRLDSLSKKPVKKTSSTVAPSRASRLIVRNLPFDITQQDLRSIFLPYGPIHAIHIPLAQAPEVKTANDAESKRSPRSKGFAFVWMLSKKDAESALKNCNGIKVAAGMANDIVADKQKRKKVRREEKKRQDTEEGDTLEQPGETGGGAKERVIAVDWALSKERWEKEKEMLGGAVEDNVKMDDTESGASTDGDSASDGEDEQLGLDEEGEDGEDDDSSDGDETPERDTDDESPQKPRLPHTDTGNTIFIRNIPFTATEDEIRTLFRAFGPLRYARLTIDPETERPRGTGFACFWNREDADKAIKQSETLRAESMGTQTQAPKNPFSLPSILTPDPSTSIAKNLVIHGRTLDVVRAVTREEAAKLKEDGEKSREKADKRNLYLLREGVILPNSPAAETIPQIELEKRTNSFNARRTLLRSNPSLYVSKTRLSIRQIPLFVTERVLKRLATHSIREFDTEVKKGVREGLAPDELAEPATVGGQDGQDVDDEEHDAKSRKPKAKAARLASVKQAKIVRQSDRADAVTGKGRSRGYGFIETHTHADALRVLRWANNNPDVGALLDQWWKEELADLVKQEKAKDDPDEARIKRLKEVTATPAKSAKGRLIVEFSIENIQVVQRRRAQNEKRTQQSQHVRRPLAKSTEEEPPSKKRRVSSDQARPVKTVRFKEEEPLKLGEIVGSVIGRKRRARKAGKRAP